MDFTTNSGSAPHALRLPLVIVNPASRGGAGARNWAHAASALRSHFGPFDCAFTEARGDATRIACDAARKGRPLVVTFGGDGTISEAARGLLAADDAGPRPGSCALGILPHGTGGDLARSLGLPTSLRDAARRLRSARTVAIDVGRVVLPNGEAKTFVNAASFGLSAEVAERINRSRSASALGYVRQTARAALRFRTPEVELEVDGKGRHRISITSVSLHNGRFFGGGMEMAPEARIDDGKLELVVVNELSLPRLLSRSPLLYWGAHQGLAEVEHGAIERLVATPVDDDVALEIDGETGFRLPARFEVDRARLPIRGGGGVAESGKAS